MKKRLWYVLVAITAMLTGAVLRMGYEVYKARPAAAGGEVLLVPLILLLLIVGYQIGRAVADCKTYSQAWQEGYNEGRIDGAMKFGTAQSKEVE